MTHSLPDASCFLASKKALGLSSPAGLAWQEFFTFLKVREEKPPGPPVPLILAAAAESDAVKHDRLVRQLDWASENHCLSEAIAFLESIPIDRWNFCPLDRWNVSGY
jgi:hypothetical protein